MALERRVRGDLGRRELKLWFWICSLLRLNFVSFSLTFLRTLSPFQKEKNHTDSMIPASNIHFYSADVSSTEDVALAAADIRSQHGNPTVLINNAGIASSESILTEPIERTRKMFEVNVLSHFICVKEFLPAMVEKDHGHVVSIASTSSFIAPSGVGSSKTWQWGYDKERGMLIYVYCVAR